MLSILQRRADQDARYSRSAARMISLFDACSRSVPLGTSNGGPDLRRAVDAERVGFVSRPERSQRLVGPPCHTGSLR